MHPLSVFFDELRNGTFRSGRLQKFQMHFPGFEECSLNLLRFNSFLTAQL